LRRVCDIEYVSIEDKRKELVKERDALSNKVAKLNALIAKEDRALANKDAQFMIEDEERFLIPNNDFSFDKIAMKELSNKYIFHRY
jgi:hypothetical protein